MKELLEAPDLVERILRSAHTKLRLRYRGLPLWVFIRDLTGHGSGYSAAIAQELGWDPHQDTTKPLPEKNVHRAEVAQ